MSDKARYALLREYKSSIDAQDLLTHWNAHSMGIGHKITELTNILQHLLGDRSLCDSEITCRLFFDYVEAVKEHLAVTDSGMYSKLLGAGGAILVFIVVFAALASSLDSLLAATSDLILTDIYKGHFRPEAGEAELASAARWVVLGLGLATWLLCLPRLTTLAELLYFTGAFVASTIWPIAAGLFWRKTNAAGAALAMIAGTAIGLTGYFLIGFYVAALISAAVSMSIVLISTWLRPADYNWSDLAGPREVRA